MVRKLQKALIFLDILLLFLYHYRLKVEAKDGVIYRERKKG